jgi:hypothetical protein
VKHRHKKRLKTMATKEHKKVRLLIFKIKADDTLKMQLHCNTVCIIVILLSRPNTKICMQFKFNCTKLCMTYFTKTVFDHVQNNRCMYMYFYPISKYSF